MDYNHQLLNPPAIVEMEFESQLSCQSILERAKKGIVPDYTAKHPLTNDELKHFPTNHSISLVDTINETMEDTLSNRSGRSVSHNIYKTSSSKKSWDVAIAYFTDNEMPISVYIAIGEATNDEILTQHDLMFYLSHNQLKVNQKDFDIGNLIEHLHSYVIHNCLPDRRNYIKKMLDKKSKGKDEKNRKKELEQERKKYEGYWWRV